MKQIEVRVPKMGMDTTEVAITKWFVAPGDRIARGNILVELESEKVSFELESEHTGEVLEILPAAGDTVPVGALLCILSLAGDSSESSSTEKNTK